MPQQAVTSIGLSEQVKKELESRKKSLSKRIGRAVSYDEVVRTLLGWVIQ